MISYQLKAKCDVCDAHAMWDKETPAWYGDSLLYLSPTWYPEGWHNINGKLYCPRHVVTIIEETEPK